MATQFQGVPLHLSEGIGILGAEISKVNLFHSSHLGDKVKLARKMGVLNRVCMD